MKPVVEKCPECGSSYLVEKTLRSGIFLECPNKKKAAEEEVVPKKRAKKGVEPVASTVVCDYSKRIGDAPPLPNAETHGPVVEKAAAKTAAKPAAKKAAKKSGKKVLQRA